ncbi:hypothetical protein BJV78DRAFT_1153280 [Lactifluus subvellereus]|nr:hypothetical protein BJV78DRAFT_1153280 [Lactifluus subvellereus]
MRAPLSSASAGATSGTELPPPPTSATTSNTVPTPRTLPSVRYSWQPRSGREGERTRRCRCPRSESVGREKDKPEGDRGDPRSWRVWLGESSRNEMKKPAARAAAAAGAANSDATCNECARATFLSQCLAHHLMSLSLWFDITPSKNTLYILIWQRRERERDGGIQGQQTPLRYETSAGTVASRPVP